MPQIKKRIKIVSLETRKQRDYIATLGWKKVVSWVASK